MKLETKRLILRDYRKQDARDLARNIGNINVSKYLLVVPYPYGVKDANDYLKRQLKKQKEKSRKDYTFAIERKSEKGVIGAIGIHEVDKYQGIAKIGYWLGADYHRQGYMQEAASKVIDFIFNKLKLRRIDVEAFGDNAASNGLIEKLGFKYEGTRVKRLRDKAAGKLHDERIYGMLREDYLKKKK